MWGFPPPPPKKNGILSLTIVGVLGNIADPFAAFQLCLRCLPETYLGVNKLCFFFDLKVTCINM